MEAHRGQQEQQPHGVRRAPGQGVGADHGQHEDVAGQGKVQVHELVANVIPHRIPEGVRVVEQHNRAGEVGGGEQRMRHQLGELRVDEDQQPLPGAAGAVPPCRQRAQGQRHGSAEDQEDGGHHGQGHVVHHVRREKDPAVDRRRTGSHVGQDPESDDPVDGPEPGPGVPAPEHLEQAQDVGHQAKDRDGDPEPVGAPLGQPALRGQFRRQLVAGDDEGRGGVRGQRLTLRRRGAAQRDGDTRRRSHHQHFDDDELPENAARGQATASAAQLRDDPAPVHQPDAAEDEGRRRLGQDQLPVGRAEEVVPGRQADAGIDHAGGEDKDEGEARQRGEPAQRRLGDIRASGGLRAGRGGSQDAGKQCQHDDAAHPGRYAHQVEAQRVDGAFVVGRAGGVADQRGGYESDEGEHQGRGQASQGRGRRRAPW